MSEADFRLLAAIGTEWSDMGPNKEYRRNGITHRPPRAALRRLMHSGYIYVRTANYSMWLAVDSDPTEDLPYGGVRIEARLTDQGRDVKRVWAP